MIPNIEFPIFSAADHQVDIFSELSRWPQDYFPKWLRPIQNPSVYICIAGIAMCINIVH